jgi:hypothetical protein
VAAPGADLDRSKYEGTVVYLRSIQRGRMPASMAGENTGTGCLPISGATTQTYTPVASDAGHTIRAQETANKRPESVPPLSATVRLADR